MLETKTDEGWAWFVAVGVFINVMFLDGTMVTFGILYPHLLAEFGASPTVTSLTGSLIPFGLMFSSPVGAALIRRFDCRRVNFLGTCIASASILVSTTCESIGPFAITYGALTGIGIGMISLSGHISINSYFNKYRGVANGIVSSGAGVGVFLMSTLLQYLLQHYSWRGTLLIYSACVLHVCICACLMRPINVASDQKSRVNKHRQVDNLNKDKQNETFQVRKTEHCNEHVPKKALIIDDKNGKAQENISLYVNSLPNISTNNEKIDFTVSDLIYSERDIHNKLIETKHVANRGQSVNPLCRKDIFYSGSLYNLKEFQRSYCMEDFLKSMTENKATENRDFDEGCSDKSKPCCGQCMSRTVSWVDLSVFKYKVFTPLLCAAVFWQMGQFIPSTYLPDYCYHIGLTENDVTVIMSIFGGMNIVGRLTSGFFSNIKSVNVLWLSIFGNTMCGLACALFPLCKTFAHMCVYSATFGYFIGYFPALQVLLLVEYLGVKNLTSAMGIYQFVKAPGALFGPPLAGVMYKITSDYAMTVTCAAVLFLSASGSQLFVPVSTVCQERSKPGTNSRNNDHAH